MLPTVRWYYFFSETDKFEASISGDKLKNELDKKITDSIEKLEKNEEFSPSDHKVIFNSFKSEIDKINKARPEEIISYSKDISYPNMKKMLSDRIDNKKYVESLFRSSLETAYSKKYDSKRKVKENIIKLGLDLQGGAYAVVTVNFSHPTMKKKYPNGVDKKSRDEMIDSAVVKIENRINKYGLSEISIQKLKDQEKIVINLPGVKEVTELRQIIETVGVLEFKLVSKDGSDLLAKLKGSMILWQINFDNEGKCCYRNSISTSS